MDLPSSLPQVYLSQLPREGPAGWTDLLYPEFPLLSCASKGVFYEIMITICSGYSSPTA